MLDGGPGGGGSSGAVDAPNTTDIEVNAPGGFRIDIRRVSFEAIALFSALVGVGCALPHILPAVNTVAGAAFGLVGGTGWGVMHVIKNAKS